MRARACLQCIDPSLEHHKIASSLVLGLGGMWFFRAQLARVGRVLSLALRDTPHTNRRAIGVTSRRVKVSVYLFCPAVCVRIISIQSMFFEKMTSVPAAIEAEWRRFSSTRADFDLFERRMQAFHRNASVNLLAWIAVTRNT